MSKPKLKSVAVALLLAGTGAALLSTPLYAGGIQEKVSVTPEKTISPSEEAIISAAGVKVLRHIAQARAEIHNKDVEAAHTELGQADKLLDIIQQALPTTSIKDRIWVARKHLEYEDTQEVLPDLIPIYSSLDELTDVVPVKAARAQLDQAKAKLEAGDKAKAKQALEETDAALQYTEIDLPLRSTRRLVAQATADLSEKKLDEADKSLKSAEDAVVFISVGVQQPLFAAKAALYQGVFDLDGGNNDLAKADLQTAIRYLEAARQSGNEATRDAATQLLAEAQSLLGDLEQGSTVTTGFHSLLERAQAYADRSVEYLATGWQLYRAESQPFKSDLIEAKLHLANAQIDLFTGHETPRATKELDAVNKLLRQAAEAAEKHTANGSYQQQIGELRKTVGTLSANPASGDLAEYTALRQQLEHMISAL
jgi:ribosomal protein S20